MKNDMVFVKAELASLRGLLKRLAAQVQSPSRGKSEAAGPSDEPQAVDFEAAMEETAKLPENRLEAIEATHRGQAIDATWAAQATDAIEQALEDKALEGSVLHALECRSTLCRVEGRASEPYCAC